MARLGSGTTTDTTSTSNELYYAGEAFRLAYDVGAGTGSRRTQTNFTGFTITAKAIAVEVTGDDVSTAVPLGTCTIDGSDTTTTKANCSGTWVQNTTVDLIPDGSFDVGVRNGQCKLTSENGPEIQLGVCTLTNDTTRVTTQTECDAITDATWVGEASMNICTPVTTNTDGSTTIVPNGTCTITTTLTGAQVVTHVPDNACIANTGETRSWDTYFWDASETKTIGQFYVYIPSTILKDVGYGETPQPGSPMYIAYSIDYTESDANNVGDAETRVIETDVIGFRWTPMFSI